MTTPKGRAPKAGGMSFAAKIAAEGGDEVVFRRVAAGETIASIMESYARDRDCWYTWIRAGGDKRRTRWEEAKKQSADALVDRAGEILDGAADANSTAQVMIAKERASHRKWLASVRDRETYGDRNGPAVQVNIQQLHLDALRKLGSMELFSPASRQITGAMATVEIEEED
jgi:hypothetical protein